MRFYEKIKDLRIESNMTQQQLADVLHIDQTTISTWELGKTYPDFFHLKKLSRFFNISVAYFLDVDDKKPNTKKAQ